MGTKLDDRVTRLLAAALLLDAAGSSHLDTIVDFAERAAKLSRPPDSQNDPATGSTDAAPAIVSGAN